MVQCIVGGAVVAEGGGEGGLGNRRAFLGDDVDDPAHGIGAVENRTGALGDGDLRDGIGRQHGEIHRSEIALAGRHAVDEDLDLALLETTHAYMGFAFAGISDHDPR